MIHIVKAFFVLPLKARGNAIKGAVSSKKSKPGINRITLIISLSDIKSRHKQNINMYETTLSKRKTYFSTTVVVLLIGSIALHLSHLLPSSYAKTKKDATGAKNGKKIIVTGIALIISVTIRNA